jgi:ABC-type lipoprotein release transport system permease subunit
VQKGGNPLILQLIAKEIQHRKLNFLLAMIAVVTAVALVVAFMTTSEASNRETTRLTRDMGFNLRIIPRNTDMDKFWTTGFSELMLPESYVQRFLAHRDFSFAHLTATLHKPVQWREKSVILTGISPEIEPSGKTKSSMSFEIKPGTAYVGFELAREFELQKGDSIGLFGAQFLIAQTLSETGSDDDIRIYTTLAEAQKILGFEGKINEIKALNCLCVTSPDQDPLEILRQQLGVVLPEAKVIMNRTIADARERQRIMFEKYFAFILPLIIVVCAACIGVLAMLNVKERKTEIGILRALGYRTGQVAGLFLGKALLLGIIGAALGFAIGTLLSLFIGPSIFQVTAKAIRPIYALLFQALVWAPAFAVVSAFLPAVVAITQDPALTLREE